MLEMAPRRVFPQREASRMSTRQRRRFLLNWALVFGVLLIPFRMEGAGYAGYDSDHMVSDVAQPIRGAGANLEHPVISTPVQAAVNMFVAMGYVKMPEAYICHVQAGWAVNVAVGSTTIWRYKEYIEPGGQYDTNPSDGTGWELSYHATPVATEEERAVNRYEVYDDLTSVYWKCGGLVIGPPEPSTKWPDDFCFAQFSGEVAVPASDKMPGTPSAHAHISNCDLYRKKTLLGWNWWDAALKNKQETPITSKVTKSGSDLEIWDTRP